MGVFLICFLLVVVFSVGVSSVLMCLFLLMSFFVRICC